jgi:hypothetical protein
LFNQLKSEIMAIYHVIKLFKTIDNDYELRSQIYDCNNIDELTSMFQSKGYYFNNDDIDNAVNMLHVNCRTMDDAVDLFNKAEWLRYLMRNE